MATAESPISRRRGDTSFGRLQQALNRIDGRENYRAQTNSPSDGDDVRWYFSKAPLSSQVVAASSPVSEVVGKNDYLRFSVNDSLSLEAAFLKEEEELVSAWWKEYAECSIGPLEASAKGQHPSQAENASDSESSHAKAVERSNRLTDMELYESDDVIGVSVKGGLYEVDLYRRRCFPVFWTGDHRRVLRGHWFAQKGGLDWLPLREDVSEQLEFAYRSQIWHRRTFQPSGKFAARVSLQSAIEGLHALFTGEDDTWEAWLCMDSSGITSILGFRGNSVKLRRGFAPSESPQPTQEELHQRKEEEMDDYCSQIPVRHLIFMVHGIGQRLEKANLVDDVGTFRHTATVLAEEHLTAYQRNSQRLLFIPCQWRRGLKLGGEQAVEDCTLEGVRALRTMLSATVHDVLYYMSPVYCQDIIDSVSGQLNKLYCKFIKRNPGYDGKVSIYGHSLGSVLSFDILCHQNKLTSSFPMMQVFTNSERTNASGLQTKDAEEKDDVLRSHQIHKEVSSVVNQDTAEASYEHNTTANELNDLNNEIARLRDKIASLEKSHGASQWDDWSPNSELRNSAYDDQDVATVSAETGREDSLNLSTCISAGMDSSHTSQTQKTYLGPRSSSRKRYTPHIEYTKLAFEVDTFFAVGSPLGVFLSLRNIRLGIGQGKDYWQDDAIDEEFPACQRMFNVFHPFDPVAYRVEPLVCKEYLHKQPVFLPYHRGGRRLHIGMQEFGKEVSARSQALVHSLTVDKVVRAFSSTSHKDEKDDVQEPKEHTYGLMIIEKLTGEPNGRIDFMLQDATFEHQYLQAISSHTAYWQDADTALFILKHLYRDIPKESPKVDSESTGNEETIDELVSPDPNLLLNQSQVADEEVAFTFSSLEHTLSISSQMAKSRGISHS